MVFNELDKVFVEQVLAKKHLQIFPYSNLSLAFKGKEFDFISNHESF